MIPLQLMLPLASAIMGGAGGESQQPEPEVTMNGIGSQHMLKRLKGRVPQMALGAALAAPEQPKPMPNSRNPISGVEQINNDLFPGR